jgi:hypothetical protein
MRWRLEIATMRSAIAAWDAVRSGNELDLRRWCVEDHEREPALVHMCKRLDIESIDNWYLIVRDASGEPVNAYSMESLDIPRREAAGDCVTELISHYLCRHCKARLSRRGGGNLAYRMHVTPRDMLGVIWWQFARWVTGESE